MLTYLIAPRDSRFFIKQYVKQLEAGDKTETSKKDPEIRRNELFDYSKAHLKTYLNKEMANMLYNGAGGILLPLVVDKLGKDADELLTTIGDVLLAKPYELIETLKSVAAANDAKINDNNGDKPKTEVKQHYVEDATCHYLIKKLAEEDTKREASGHLSTFSCLCFFTIFVCVCVYSFLLYICQQINKISTGSSAARQQELDAPKQLDRLQSWLFRSRQVRTKQYKYDLHYKQVRYY